MSNPITRYVHYDQSYKITNSNETNARHIEDVIVARIEKQSSLEAMFGAPKEVIVFSRIPAHKIKIADKAGKVGSEGCELGSPKVAFNYVMQRINESNKLTPKARQLLGITLRGNCREGLIGDHRRSPDKLLPASENRLSPKGFEDLFEKISEKDKVDIASAKLSHQDEIPVSAKFMALADQVEGGKKELRIENGIFVVYARQPLDGPKKYLEKFAHFSGGRKSAETEIKRQGKEMEKKFPELAKLIFHIEKSQRESGFGVSDYLKKNSVAIHTELLNEEQVNK